MSRVAVCSDVAFHVWNSVNVGTAARPDIRKVDQALQPTGHERDPFDRDGHRRCAMLGTAFGSRVLFRAPGLNQGRAFAVTAPSDRDRVLIVRFTKNSDASVSARQESVVRSRD
ncbi:hypothetical protein [Actinomadura rupiterrae]|uniref:hypothetical protein n=1 Tax=Actinomadura rupiterrae TaxID=559627 RepID=UPI0020A364AD|nr:hypothetical protein [Actinomadura rupiterrae]MCP2342107.1 hypothetical protein [Actinomadura rupiterrae]